MLVKLMYQDAECIMDGEMHVNPEHIVSVRMRDDGRLALMQLDSAESMLGPDGLLETQVRSCVQLEQEGAMSSTEYRIAMYETHVTRAMMFALFAALMYRDSGLSPEFWIMTAAAIFNVIAAAWLHWRKAQ